ncbi:MAG: TraR/DksA C4-type zinc finger protein [Thermodesulfovibrionales bacterium]|nr:TraR/DksA C4-type zinc finger protein [Thermodesulfovibrionales bacterium]
MPVKKSPTKKKSAASSKKEASGKTPKKSKLVAQSRKTLKTASRPKGRAIKPSAVKPAKAKKPVAKKPAPKKPARKMKAVLAAESPEVGNEMLRRTLIQRREQIVGEAKAEIKKYIKGENRQLVESALDDGDWSVIDLSEDINLMKLGIHRKNLLKIDEALRKLREGTYGICEDCGEEIVPERLRILPFAIFCRDCQEKMELIEAVEKAGR